MFTVETILNTGVQTNNLDFEAHTGKIQTLKFRGQAQNLGAIGYWAPVTGCPLVTEKSGNFFFLHGQGKVREFCKMGREIRKSSKVREKSGNFKIMLGPSLKN